MTGESVESRLRIIRENLRILDDLAPIPLEEFESSPLHIHATLHQLQATIRALIDVGIYKVRVFGLGSPRTSHEIFEMLESDGYLPDGSAHRFSPIIGFRNRIVHLYDRVDPRIVHRILTENRSDLAELADLLLGVRES